MGATDYGPRAVIGGFPSLFLDDLINHLLGKQLKQDVFHIRLTLSVIRSSGLPLFSDLTLLTIPPWPSVSSIPRSRINSTDTIP